MDREARAYVKSLIQGIERYERLERARYKDRFAALAGGQSPLAMLITCSDSRMVPSLVASAGPGELFIVRNVANLVPPFDENGGGDTSVASALWYALEVLEVRNVVVCGHSNCGGVKALLAPDPPRSDELRRWLAPASASVGAWRIASSPDPRYAAHDQLSQVLARQQLENLRTYPFVRARAERGELDLHAWWFDIAAGRMLAYSDEGGRYVPAVEALRALDEPQQDVA